MFLDLLQWVKHSVKHSLSRETNHRPPKVLQQLETSPIIKEIQHSASKHHKITNKRSSPWASMCKFKHSFIQQTFLEYSPHSRYHPGSDKEEPSHGALRQQGKRTFQHAVNMPANPSETGAVTACPDAYLNVCSMSCIRHVQCGFFCYTAGSPLCRPFLHLWRGQGSESGELLMQHQAISSAVMKGKTLSSPQWRGSSRMVGGQQGWVRMEQNTQLFSPFLLQEPSGNLPPEQMCSLWGRWLCHLSVPDRLSKCHRYSKEIHNIYSVWVKLKMYIKPEFLMSK